MKKCMAWLLVMVMAFGLFGCKQEAATVTRSPETQATEPMETDPTEKTEVGTATPLLYKVSDEKGNVIWLFGSIHVGREEYYALPDYVMDAYNGSDALALEFDMLSFQSDFAAQSEMAQAMLYLDGTDISNHIPEELYDKAVTYMEEAGMYYSAMDYCLPVMWYSVLQEYMMSEIGAKSELGIDQYFARLAVKDGKETLELESAQFQFEMLAGLSNELQVSLLEGAVQACEMPELYEAGIDLLMNVWASGDEEGFGDYLLAEDETVKQTTPELYEEYSSKMIVSRNEAMTRWAEDALASGKEVFIVVGAAHIVGAGAMAENLRELGYRVELVK